MDAEISMVRNGRILPLWRRLWIYQAERFPLLSHGLLVTIMAAGSLGFSARARGQAAWPGWLALAAASFCALGFFFQLRVADEYKDFHDDQAHRPYRPVPRGLIRLEELALLAVTVAGIQAGLTLWLGPALLPFLLAVWAYMAAMRWEFGLHRWLRARPWLYLASHMVIVPLIVLFLTAWDWRLRGSNAPPGLGWFLALGFFNGVLFEVGRKVRAPADEEAGVETYTALWGCRKATLAWLAALALAALCALAAARPVGMVEWTGSVAAGLGVWAIIAARRFLQRPVTARARQVPLISALWVLALYVVLGILPFLLPG
ncbi:UbiA family prenyltransferase [Litorilinea aerophila]|nr:UbiA family prenyltransferase [Litorilinea aerophila]MCC9076976.1 UbiA family prenyltransferase [Litorilinea aerophila]